MLIAFKAFLIPRSTSHTVLAPSYEKPLLQLKWNTNGDRGTWVKELPTLPPGIPPAAATQERNCEGEMMRLASNYGIEAFRKVYPIDEIFEKVFAACQTVVMPSQQQDVPNMELTNEMLVAELLELNVPAMDETKAKKIIEAGHTVASLPHVDAKGLAGITGLSTNLIRSVIEAAKLREADAPRGAPSAPSEFRATIKESVPT
jgi:hypothetical protein